MANVPHDLIKEVLVWLPVKSLLRFRCVCKSWYEVINNRDFIYSHFRTCSDNRVHIKLICHYIKRNNYTRICAFDINHGFEEKFLPNFQIPQITPSSSAYCNGLIFFADQSKYELYVLNPSTRHCRKLPSIPTDLSQFYSRSCICFGYDANADDYKAIVLIPSRSHTSYHQFWIFGLKSSISCWRRIQDFPYHDVGVANGGNGFLDGCVHFLCRQDEWRGSYVIAAFDVAKETFSMVPLPIYQPGKLVDFQVFEGRLSIMFSSQEKGDFYVRIKKEEGIVNEFTWTKLFSIKTALKTRIVGLINYYVRTLGYSKEEDKILLLFSTRMYSYDLKRKRLQQIEMPSIDGWNSILCNESLVSVHG